MDQPQITTKTEEKKKKGFGAKFITFLSMGGFIVIIFVILAIAVAISLLFN